MTEEVIIERARRHGERLRRIRAASHQAWWDNIWREHLPATTLRFGARGELYIERGRTLINVDRARARGRLARLQSLGS